MNRLCGAHLAWAALLILSFTALADEVSASGVGYKASQIRTAVPLRHGAPWPGGVRETPFGSGPGGRIQHVVFIIQETGASTTCSRAIPAPTRSRTVSTVPAIRLP